MISNSYYKINHLHLNWYNVIMSTDIKTEIINQKVKKFTKKIAKINQKSYEKAEKSFLPSLKFWNANDKQYENAKYEEVLWWTSNLPYSPQAVTYIVNTLFKGWQLVLTEGSNDNESIKTLFTEFVKKANKSNLSLLDVLRIMVYDSLTKGVGDGYIEKVVAPATGKLAEVYNIDPNSVKVYSDKNYLDRGIFVLQGYSKVDNLISAPETPTMTPDQMVHFQYIQTGQAYGKHPLEHNAEISRLIMSVITRNRAKFKNEVRHSFHIHFDTKGKSPETIQEEFDKFVMMYQTIYMGESNYGKPLFTFGDVSAEPIVDPTDNFDYQEFIESTGKNHAPSLFNVSLSELDNSNSKYTNSKQGYISTMENTIFPLQDRIEDIVNTQLFPQLEGRTDGQSTYKLVLSRANVSTNYESLQSVIQATNSGIISTNEARSIVDNETLIDIDQDWANEYIKTLGDQVFSLDNEFYTGNDSALSAGEGKAIINLSRKRI